MPTSYIPTYPTLTLPEDCGCCFTPVTPCWICLGASVVHVVFDSDYGCILSGTPYELDYTVTFDGTYRYITQGPEFGNFVCDGGTKACNVVYMCDTDGTTHRLIVTCSDRDPVTHAYSNTVVLYDETTHTESCDPWEDSFPGATVTL